LARRTQPIADGIERRTEILHEVKAIGNLDRLGRTLRRACGARPSPITSDDSHTGMGLKPAGKRGGGIRGAHVNWTMRGPIDQDGVVVLAFALRPFVHAACVWRWP